MEYDKVFKKQISFIKNLSPEIKETINWYTGDSFAKFNNQLRKTGTVIKSYKKHLSNLDKAFSLVPPITEPLFLYKGKTSETVFSDKSFISTSQTFFGTEPFIKGGCCLLKIMVSVGSKVLPIKHFSKNPEEEEVLLDRDAVLYVTGSSIEYPKNNALKYIYVSYLPKNSMVIHENKSIDIAEKKINKDAIIESIVELIEYTHFEDEDIEIMFKKLSNENIPKDILKQIKDRL